MSVDTFSAIPAGELILLATGIAASGLVAGVVAGMLGVGGGIVLVALGLHILSEFRRKPEAPAEPIIAP